MPALAEPPLPPCPACQSARFLRRCRRALSRSSRRRSSNADKPVHIRHEIVHNKHVVNALKSRGAVFVESLDEVNDGHTVVFSAHGVPKSVPQEARRTGAWTISTRPVRS